MKEQDAADYLSIGTTTLRERGPKPKKFGHLSLWDIHDLDRFADALGGLPLDGDEAQSHARDVEAEWRANRKKQGKS